MVNKYVTFVYIAVYITDKYIKMSKKRYHITKTNDGWQTKREEAKRASATADTKAEMIKVAAELAKNQGDASVIIHKQNGRIQEERTYPRSKDPNPPKG